MTQKSKIYPKIRVTLINWTPKPIETMAWAFLNMHNPVPNNLSKLKLTQKEKVEFMDMLNKIPHQTVLEYVNMVFLVEGASRVWQQQWTRNRKFSFSIQSLRIVNVGKFADNKEYTKSSLIKSKPEAEKLYDETMLYLQERYNKLISLGCPTEDARGILPLNIHSPVTFACNLRDLEHALELRYCYNAQEEAREIAQLIKQEIATKMDKLLTTSMVPVCFRTGRCPSPINCGKYPKFKQEFENINTKKWLKG